MPIKTRISRTKAEVVIRYKGWLMCGTKTTKKQTGGSVGDAFLGKYKRRPEKNRKRKEKIKKETKILLLSLSEAEGIL